MKCVKCTEKFEVSRKQAFSLLRSVAFICPHCEMEYTHNYWAPAFAGLAAGVSAGQLKLWGTEYLHYFSFAVVFLLVWLLIVWRWPLQKSRTYISKLNQGNK